MIEVEGLTRRFHDRELGTITAVDHVSFRAGPGEIVGLLGPNGAGKTTTMRMLATLIVPDEGTARVNGHDVRLDAAEVRRSIGYLSASTGLYGRLTAREVLEYVARLQGCADAAGRADALVARFEIERFAHVTCDRLSTGMKQKVNIARALVHDPPVLIFDEPTSGLDVLVAQQLFTVLEEARAAGKCVLYSTHIMGEAERLCSRVVVIHGGRVRAETSLDELRSRAPDGRLETAFIDLVAGSSA
ncbi:MAG: ATP-binding cassette domain-containing protein [Deltaproteobacteria bacterium]|nr:ATP-binding cassette domain-containing protein [Deltaproteobacteria bacterium]